MAVFQTAGEPPSSGKTILANIGSSQNTSRAPRKTAAANNGRSVLATGGAAATDGASKGIRPLSIPIPLSTGGCAARPRLKSLGMVGQNGLPPMKGAGVYAGLCEP